MVPVGLLAIIAFGLVVAYVLPQRIREQSDYAHVRSDDRYSAQLRVVKSTASRVERSAARPSTDSSAVPLLVTGTERASSMSRPVGPLDKAATQAQREQMALHRDRAAARSHRASQARRRAVLSSVFALGTATAWGFVIWGSLPAVVAAVVTAGLVSVVGVSARTAAAQRAVDARQAATVREVEAVATATQALRVVTRERAAGHDVQPSELATAAIRVVTTADLARTAEGAVPAEADGEAGAGKRAGAGRSWSPPEMPAPAYTLKTEVTPRQARPLTDDDYSAATARAARWEGLGDPEALQEARRSGTAGASGQADAASTEADAGGTGVAGAAEPEASSGALDAILARRRRASA